MNRHVGSLPPTYFENLYTTDPDPWQFATSPYERAKYAATLAALPLPRYANAFEVGCAIGVLTQQLAPRCDHLLSVDVSDRALSAARGRCAGLPQVRFDHCRVPHDWPEDTFDLILLSEVIYYLSPDDVTLLAGKVRASARAGATVLLVHWTGETDYPLSGDAAAGLFIGALERETTHRWSTRAAAYRMDRLVLA